MNNLEIVSKMKELIEKGESFALATVISTSGSSLGKPGFKAVISKEGKIIAGTIGGVCPESAIAEVSMQAISTGIPRIVRVHLESVENSLEAVVKGISGDDIYVETNCGGMMQIYVEPYLQQERIVLIGQGGKDDVEDAIVRIAKILGYYVVVIDHEPVLTEKPDLLIDELDFDVSNFGFRESDFVVVLTKGSRDVDVLSKLSRFNVRYVGLLASKQRAKEDLDSLRKLGIESGFIKKIRAPVGINIGATTPEEIALSILAEITAFRRNREVAIEEIAMKLS